MNKTINGYKIKPYADLNGANLRGANLTSADLSGADLRGANLRSAKLPAFQIPQDGSLTVWKKLKQGRLAKLYIPAKAKRTASLVGRKCRTEYVKVLQVYDSDGKPTLKGSPSRGDGTYLSGSYFYPDKYDDDIRVECTNGVHFFLTREEAEEYSL